MQLLALRLALVALFVLCFGSFNWAMRRFFVLPERSQPAVNWLRITGIFFALLHFTVLLWTPRFAWPVYGAVIYLLSFGLFWWAWQTNRNQPLTAIYSPDLPDHLVDQGPYRWIRHPFYTSYLLGWLAGILATGVLWLIPTFFWMLFLYWRAARAEEAKFASSSLAAAYERYRRQTGRFLPNLLKIFAESSNGMVRNATRVE